MRPVPAWLNRRAAIAGAAVLALAGVGVGAALAFAGARHTTPAPPRASNVVATLTPLATPSVAPGSALTSAVLTQSDLGASGAMLHEVSCSFGSPVDSGHGFLASACRNFNDSTGVAWLNIQAGVFDAPADAHQQYLALKNVSTATSAYTIGDEAFAQSACTATSCSRYAVSWRHGPVLIVMSFATFSGSVLPAITPSDVAALVQMQDAKLGAVST
jgi:hypothetical protein